MSFTDTNRRIADLRPGESAYIPDHAAWVQGQHMYVNADFPLRGLSAMGSHSIRLVRFPDGRLAVDVSEMQSALHRGFNPYGENSSRLKVDFEIVKPNPTGMRCLNDLRRGESAYVSTSAAWIWGPHMWIDGSAEIAGQMSAEKPLRVHRELHGEYVVDVSRCRDALYAHQPANDRNWPIQVARAVTPSC